MKKLFLGLILSISAWGQVSINGGRVIQGPVNYVAGGGSADAQTATYSPAIIALATGVNYCWLPTAANATTTPTLAINGLTAKTITKLGHTALVANDLTTTAIACAIYDGTDFQLQNPQVAASSGVTSIATTSPITGGTITTTGTIACPTCVTTSPAMVLLMELTANNSAGSLQFITRNVTGQSGAMFQSDYDTYQCEIVGLIPATNTTQIVGNFGVGSTFDTGSNYGWAGWRVAGGGGSAVAGSDSTTSFGLDAAGGASSSATAGGFSGTLKIYGPTNGVFFPRYTAQASYNNGAPTNIMATMSGVYSVATAATSWEIRAASGNLVSGNVRCYGITK